MVASCGTSLAEDQIKLMGRFTKRVVVNYDPDAAGQAATERSLTLLLEKEFDVRVLALPPVNGKPADPDKFLQEQGSEAYSKDLLVHAPAYFDYLISKARQMDRSTANGKLAAVNFLMPYLQKMPEPPPALGVGHPHRVRPARGRAGTSGIAAPRRRRAP